MASSQAEPPEKKSKRDLAYLDLLEDVIKDVYETKEMSKSDYMKFYTLVYNYATNHYNKGVQPDGQEFCNLLKTYLHGRLTELIQVCLIKSVDTLQGEDVLLVYAEQWEKYKLSSERLNGVCGFLNRRLMLRKQGRKHENSIYRLALFTWKDTIFENLRRKVTSATLNLIENERKGVRIHSELLSSVIGSFVELGLEDDDKNCSDESNENQNQNEEDADQPKGPQLGTYQKHFENQFLNDTESFYLVEAKEFIAKNPVTEYMKKVEQRLMEENTRIGLYLHDSTSERLMEICVNVLIRKQLDTLQNEFKSLLHDEKTEDLGRMYMIMRRIDYAIGEMRNNFELHIYAEGMRALDGLGNQKMTFTNLRMYITSIIDVYEKYKKLVITAFKNDSGFMDSFNKACGKLIHKNAVTQSKRKSPELLAGYCNLLLKSSVKMNHDLEEAANQVVIVFNYLTEKDAFQKLYSVLLAKRLISQNSTTNVNEYLMIEKLKNACGILDRLKWERLYRDMVMCEDSNDQFKNLLRENHDALPFDFQIQVISNELFPFTRGMEFPLPFEMQQSVDKFSEFYKIKYKERKLIWEHGRSHGEVVTNCFKNRYVFQSSMFQMTVLLMFNSKASYRVEELATATKLNLDILIKVLRSLCNEKILEVPTEEDLMADTVLNVVEDYENKKLCININVPFTTQMKQEKEQATQTIEEDQKNKIKAAIVRKMKMCKVCTLQQIVTAVLNQLASRCNPHVDTIKECIDILIEMDYIEQTVGQDDTYSYLTEK